MFRQTKVSSMTFASLGLHESILRAVTERGYETPTPIQAQAIPAVLSGRDLLAGAQTGTGKTAGFTLPILQRLITTPAALKSNGKKPVRVLVLVPTRELAAQVEESVQSYGKYVDINSTTIFGGVGIHPQIDRLRKGVDIVVATPGRLLDHLGQKTVDLSQIEIESVELQINLILRHLRNFRGREISQIIVRKNQERKDNGECDDRERF